MGNPLCVDLLALLQAEPQGLSEYELLGRLSDHSVLQTLEGEGHLSLFKKHFLVMNGLYQLQRDLWQEDGLWLEVSPLCVKLEKTNINIAAASEEVGKNDHSNSPEVFSPLSAYYLDWSHFDQASEESVQELLDSFWIKFASLDKRDAALVTLGLDQDSTPEQITQRYRLLAAKNHPDKGGTTEKFVAIRQAFEVLRHCW